MKLSPHQTQRLASQYESRWHRTYAASKMRTDPLYEAVTSRLLSEDDGTTPLLDVGCGIGLFIAYLREAGFTGPVVGIDYDAEKIAAAAKLQFEISLDSQFRCNDIRAELPTFRGNITLLDVLQFLNSEGQNDLLRALAKAVIPGGMLIIRGGLLEPTWRYRVTQASDWMAKAALWMKSGPVSYPTRESICNSLESEGMTGEFHPLWGRTPFNNYLGVFRKRRTPPNGAGSTMCHQSL